MLPDLSPTAEAPKRHLSTKCPPLHPSTHSPIHSSTHWMQCSTKTRKTSLCWSLPSHCVKGSQVCYGHQSFLVRLPWTSRLFLVLLSQSMTASIQYTGGICRADDGKDRALPTRGKAILPIARFAFAATNHQPRLVPTATQQRPRLVRILKGHGLYKVGFAHGLLGVSRDYLGRLN